MNNESQRNQRPATANVLLVNSRAVEQAFEKALGSVPGIELLSTRRTGSQTVINITVSDLKSEQVLDFLRDTVRLLTGFTVRIQGATLGPVPTVVCRAVAANDQSTRRSRFRRRRRVEPQPAQQTATAHARPTTPTRPTRPTGATEVPGIRPDPASVFTPQLADDSSEYHPPSIIDFSIVWQVIRNSLVVVLFLFGDVELALAKWHRIRNSSATSSAFNLKNQVVSGVKNSLLGIGFIFGDIEVGYRKLRAARPTVSKQHFASIATFLGVVSLLTRALVETIFGHEQSESEQANNSPKT